MSVKLSLENYTSANVKERNILDADYDVGSTVLLVVNNQNAAANDYVLLGVPGSETGEIRTVASVAGATGMTVDATTLHHERFDPVTILRGNKIKIYTAPNVDGTQPADSAFSTLLATIDIDPDQTSTTYIHDAGTSALWYKYVFYNSTTLTSTDIALSGAVRGGEAGNYCSVDAIRDEAGFENNYKISDTKIDTFRKQAQSAINGALVGLYTLPFTAPVNPHIERITVMLAAGYLQIDQFGQTYNTNNAGTNNKVAWAEDELQKIKSGQTVLTDPNGGSTTTTGGTGFVGYPNGDTTTATNGTEDFMFERSSIAGYNGRQY